MRNTLAGAIPRLSRRIQANQLVISVARFGRPAVDAVPRQPPAMNYNDSYANRSDERVSPGAPGIGGRSDDQRHTEQRLEKETPARLVLRETSKVEMAEHQTGRG